ncbi:MAG: CAP domain-containing protein [Leadbetterella sp.]
MKTRILIIIALWTCILACEKKTDSTVEPTPEVKKLTYQEEALKLVNELRTKGTTCGSKVMPPVAELVLSEKLNEVALAHSKDMHVKKYFAHKNLEGKSHRDRIRAAGYQDVTSAENIYESSLADAEWAVGAWKISQGHCQNMMDPSYKEMGIGNYESYWTQLFATKK